MGVARRDDRRSCRPTTTLRCVILRGAGEKAFSPGNDIAEFATERSNKTQAIEYGTVMHRTADALATCRHPLVAQIHGICVGGGLEIAALCDLRICGESSRFGAPIKNLGLVMAYAGDGAAGATRRARRRARDPARGPDLRRRRSEGKGLVTRVVPDDQVAAEARATAQRIADGAPLVARWHKKFARRLAERTPLTAAEHDECFDCFDTEDFRIGYAAFLAKQKPQFIAK